MSRTLRSLLLALLLVALCAPTAAVGAESEQVSEMSDSRIKESSGLAISAEHDDLAYTINDAGNAPIVYGIKISTGEVVGTTRVGGGDIEDSESIAIDGDGTMWVADLGDNDEERDDTALYAFPEPGPGDDSVTAKRYPVSYDGGAVDIEAFLVHPETGEKLLASKQKKKDGTLFSLPAKLSENGDNRATDLGKKVPRDVSDGTFTPDGTQALIRTRSAVHLFDPKTWSEIGLLEVPEVEQGESIAMEPDGKAFLIGSEGKNSPLIRVSFGPQASAEATPPAEQEPTEEAAEADDETDEGVTVPVYAIVAIIAVGVLALVAVWAARRRNT
ncbi:MAG: hypothetical protein ACRDOT_07345 [Aeromicrobium sp.]